MRSFSIFLCILVSNPARGQRFSLIDALRNVAGATQFAQTIEDNPSLKAIFLSSTTRTIFAPSDDALEKLSTQNNHSIVSRQSSDSADAAYQACTQHSNIGNVGAEHGGVFDEQPRPGIDTGISTSTSTSTSTKKYRKVVSKPSEAQHANLTKRATHQDYKNIQNPIQIFSGLGDIVNLTKKDIVYHGGLIHVIDG